METIVRFLCTQVSKYDRDDWKKLRRGLAFLKETIGDARIISATDLSSIFTWIDVSYIVNSDTKIQIGGVMSMELGVLHAKSGKQRLNTKSLTEVELVGTSEYIHYNLWMLLFIAEQG